MTKSEANKGVTSVTWQTQKGISVEKRGLKTKGTQPKVGLRMQIKLRYCVSRVLFDAPKTGLSTVER